MYIEILWIKAMEKKSNNVPFSTYCMRLENSFFFKLRIVLSFCENFSLLSSSVDGGRMETGGKAGLLNMITICVMNEGSFSKKLSERFSPFLPTNLLDALTSLDFALHPMPVRAKIPFPNPPSLLEPFFLLFVFYSSLFSDPSNCCRPKAHFSSNRYILIRLQPCFSYRFLIRVRSLLWLRRPCQPFIPWTHTLILHNSGLRFSQIEGLMPSEASYFRSASRSSEKGRMREVIWSSSKIDLKAIKLISF